MNLQKKELWNNTPKLEIPIPITANMVCVLNRVSGFKKYNTEPNSIVNSTKLRPNFSCQKKKLKMMVKRITNIPFGERFII